ncbi:MAG: IPTL-CTERM sorting domain-containing protein [Gammaproteobacteria bacterium]|nr:IPTL-CTERM sorting domain-containing protein [Gammaproteobacteria bacterium]
MRKLERGLLIAGILAFASAMAQAQTTTFNYTGAEQTFVVPAGVTTITVEAWGASGWSGTGAPGGLGGYATGNLSVTPGETLYIYVGGQGTVANGDRVPAGGGFNGGGNGQSNGFEDIDGSVGGGGGASDFRQGGNTLNDRVLVAGGGGGATENATPGGNGGGLTGSDGGQCCGGSLATGGTQVAGGSLGGSFGQGGNADPVMTPWNGGGGGGWYGGGVSDAHSGGGGGSSYIGGVSGGSTTGGVRSGDGMVALTYSAAVASTPVPALSHWGLLALGLILVIAATWAIPRRRASR